MKRDKYDKIVSDLIREANDYVCEKCQLQLRENPRACHCSHFKGRAIVRLRHDLHNVSCLCAGCHKHLGEHPDEHADWFNDCSVLALDIPDGFISDLGYDYLAADVLNEKLNLYTKSMSKVTKQDKDAMLSHYKEELERILQLRSEGVSGYIKPLNWWAVIWNSS